jgi:hypothetical protein
VVPDREIATASGETPTRIAWPGRRRPVAIGVTWSVAPSTISAVAPSGVTARASGAWPAGIGGPAWSSVVVIGVTVFEP